MKTKNVFLHHPEIDGEIREESVILSLKNLKFNRVKSVKESDKKIENLYDLRVLDVPNYSTDISLVHNGGGRRKGSFAIYLEPWHYDVENFLNLRKNHGKEEMRARDLFLALWIPDLFMERVRDNSEWTLFSPDEAPGLDDVYGEEFNALYTKYEDEGKGRKSIKAQDLWYKIIESQIETGVPYMLYKDAANSKSNQKNLGTIKSSNLCLSGDTLVDVRIEGEEYKMRLHDVVDSFKKGNSIFVRSLDVERESVEYQLVTNGAIMSLESDVIEIEDTESGKKIVCTPDHQIFTKNRGYVKAGDLVESDVLYIN